MSKLTKQQIEHTLSRLNETVASFFSPERTKLYALQEAAKLTVHDKHKMLKSGKAILKKEIQPHSHSYRGYNIDDFFVFPNPKAREAEALDKELKTKENTIRARQKIVEDELILGDSERAMALLKAFIGSLK